MKFPKKKNYADQSNYNRYRQSHDTCEKCFAPAVDVHHIIFKGAGGGRRDDRDCNLIALCRSCHEWAHGKESRYARIELQLIKEAKDAGNS